MTAEAASTIRQIVQDFWSAFETRSMDAVLEYYPNPPEDWQRAWRDGFVENGNFRDLRATIVELSDPEIAGERATIEFQSRLEYRDVNSSRDVPLRFRATLGRSGETWSIVALEQVP